MFACDGINCAVARNTLTGKSVPLNVAPAPGPPLAGPSRQSHSARNHLRRILIDQVPSSPCVPGAEVAATVTTVEPVVQPALHVP